LNHQDTKNTKAGRVEKQLEDIAHRVIGAAIEVHRELGPGYLEKVYEDALLVELGLQGIKATPQFIFALDYKGHKVGEGRIDILVEDSLVLELKAVDDLAPVHTAQVISYLKATRHRLGLLMNFNTRILKDGIKRIVL
jgi:GxxExxY protein